MFDEEKELRLHCCMIGDDLSYWALYVTDAQGQWMQAMDHTTDPFGNDEDARRHLAEIVKAWIQYVGRA